MLSELILRFSRHENLSRREAMEFIEMVLEGANEHQVTACLALLHAKGETPEELAGFVDGMRRVQRSVTLSKPALDIVGTGGDMAGTINISTGANLLARACGVPIAKVGNRSASSRCGSADLLEEFGLRVELTPAQAERCFEQAEIVFLFAPSFHPATARVVSIRRALRVPTVFNLLGPLLNPAQPKHQVIGVANPTAMEAMAYAAKLLGAEHTLIVHGNGLDELTPLGPVDVLEVTQDAITRQVIDPVALGFRPCKLESLQGGDASLNAKLLREALGGKPGPIADSLILTAAAGLYVFGAAKNLIEGVAKARSVQEAGSALQVIGTWVSVAKEVS